MYVNIYLYILHTTNFYNLSKYISISKKKQEDLRYYL